MSSYNRILGYDRFTGSWNNIACNSTGALYVTGLTGGSGSGDASAENQVLQLEQAQESNIALFNQLETQTDRLLYDLDIIANRLHDISGTVTVDNQISGFSTESKQDTLITETQNSNVAQYGQLAIIAEAGEISTSYLQGISTKLSGLPRGTASYTLDAKTTLAPDTVPAYSVPPNSIPASDGWYYKNLVLGNTSQLYYYANIATQTKNYDYQINSVQSQFAVVRILNLNAVTSLPFLVVYSQPQGAGDNIPGFARSVWVYQIKSTEELRLGEQVMIYRGIAPDSRIYPNVRRVECVLTNTRGPALTSEILAYATINTDSAAPINTVEYVCKGAGLTFAGDHIYEVELTGESDSGSTGGATESKQDTQITTAQQSNTAICVRLDKNTYTASNLHVRDDSLKSSMESQFTNLNSVIGQGLYINMDSDPVISGGVKLRGLTDGNLFVYDTRAESKLIDCITELQSVNGTLTNLADGTQQLWVHTSSADDSIEIHGYNPVLQMPESIHTVDNSAKVYVNNTLTVTETNPISGFALETTQSDIKTQTDLLTFSSKDGLNALLVKVDNQITQPFSVTETNPLTDYATETTSSSIKNTTDKLSFVDKGTYQNLKVEVDNTTLDTHCFASSDGTIFHHLHSDINGNLITLSRTHDGSGHDIASLATEADGRALNTVLFGYDPADDALKRLKIGEGPSGGLYVENSPATNLVVGKGLPMYSALYTGALNAADNFGDLTVADYSTCDVMIKIPANACSASGYLYVSFSEDGSTGSWYDTSIGVNINTSASDKTYWLNVPTFNMSHISVTGRSPWGSGTLATTNAIIRICLKK